MADPTYLQMGDHTEALQLDYDPSRVSFAVLLDLFWESHDPTYRPWKRQYMSLAFYHDAIQQEVILKAKERVTRELGRMVHTEILPAERFYLAEFYHQKYYLQQVAELRRDFLNKYPEQMEFVNSTAVARVNGYVGGYGTMAGVARDIDQLGLSLPAQQQLREFVSRSRT